MWYEPPKYIQPIRDINKDLAMLQGELDDKEAQITLAQYLYRNIGIAAYYLTGIELDPDQIITIKGMMKHNYTLCVWGRGVSKTWTAAVYCLLQCLFEENTTILVAGPTFRTSRFIFNHIEKICNSPEARLMAQCMGKSIRRNDEFRWGINGGEIIAIPLNGEKIRGFRATILLIDEFLLMSEEMVEKVLIPYLVVPKDQVRRKHIRKIEDEKIRKGLKLEEDRTVFANTSKLIGLSSASYTCEYLYRKYDEFRKQIYSDKMPETKSTYFISQLSWEAVPIDRIDRSIIELAQSNEANSANYQREYCGQFLDGSDSFFSMNKMLECSIPDGQDPSLLLAGDKEKRYVLSIDPSMSNSEKSDHFAMKVIELHDNLEDGTVVHAYAEAGLDPRDHINYFFYLLTNFNIELIVIDNAGYQFIDFANESELFIKNGINIKFFDFHPEKDGEELQEQYREARKQYNKSAGRIAFRQYFGAGNFIGKANEELQRYIDFKKIWFGGSIKGNPLAFNRATAVKLNPALFNFESLKMDPKLIADEQDRKQALTQFLIDKQQELIKQTRYQCASIELTTTARGTQTFDLPTAMRNDTSTSRQRRDSYTALLLGVWGAKNFAAIMRTPVQTYETFEPILV